jgi:hypothetical protein
LFVLYFHICIYWNSGKMVKMRTGIYPSIKWSHLNVQFPEKYLFRMCLSFCSVIR